MPRWISRSRTRCRPSSSPPEKISARIDTLEQFLQDQAESLADLQFRASQADQNLQKLVNAVDRLCEQEAVIVPSPETFAAEISQRLGNSLVRGTEPPRRTRITLAQAMVAAASIFIGVRFIR